MSRNGVFTFTPVLFKCVIRGGGEECELGHRKNIPGTTRPPAPYFLLSGTPWLVKVDRGLQLASREEKERH